MARTANEQLFDEAVRRKIVLLRLERGEVDRMNAFLHELERDLLDQIGGRLASGYSTERLDTLLRSVQELVDARMTEAAQTLESVMADLAEQEALWEASTLARVSPVQLNLASVSVELVRALAAEAVQGLTIKKWFGSIGDQAAVRIERALRLGIAEGQTLDALIRRVRGTRANGFSDGIIEATRRDAAAIARTGLSEVSTSARQLVWEANADIVLCLRWTSVLDGRTTAICISRDGHVRPVSPEGDIPEDVLSPRLVPPGASPPAHINCRSILVAVLSALALAGDRPFVADDRVRATREAQFRKEAKARDVSVQQVRREWTEAKVGQVPAKTTYPEWFTQQSAEFQRSVLGPTRYKMYQSGLKLESFVDNSGHRLTIQELRSKH